MPLLADAIARNGDYGDEAAAAARAELQRLAAAMDAWNKRAPRLLDHLSSALDLMDDGECRAAHVRIANALRTLRGGDYDLVR